VRTAIACRLATAAFLPLAAWSPDRSTQAEEKTADQKNVRVECLNAKSRRSQTGYAGGTGILLRPMIATRGLP
jgi:hypothetical protein